jgi:hypothetical protein
MHDGLCLYISPLGEWFRVEDPCDARQWRRDAEDWSYISFVEFGPVVFILVTSFLLVEGVQFQTLCCCFGHCNSMIFRMGCALIDIYK